MRLISKDFTNLLDKSIYDIADEDALDKLFNFLRYTISKERFERFDNLARIGVFYALSEVLNNKELQNAVEKEEKEYDKFVQEQRKKGIIVD